MKHARVISAALLGIVLCVFGLEAQSEVQSETLKGMSLNGATGLYSIPSAKVGWESTGDIGLDFGYHAIISDGYATHIPKISVSLFKWVEVSMAFDIQPDRYYRPHDNNNDFFGGMKIQLPLPKTAVAFGGNFQALNVGADEPHAQYAGQAYVAVTYSGAFFEMPAETTVVVGKTIKQRDMDSDIDFGMGFDLTVMPTVFDSFLHWVTDFSNFSYSANAFGADASRRGVLNTGLRIDLSRIPPLSRFKFVLDLVLTDAFDDATRSFAVGAVFGVPLK